MTNLSNQPNQKIKLTHEWEVVLNSAISRKDLTNDVDYEEDFYDGRYAELVRSWQLAQTEGFTPARACPINASKTKPNLP
jgi:hypothetical protein